MKILLIHLKGFLSIAQNLEPRHDDFVATAYWVTASLNLENRNGDTDRWEKATLIIWWDTQSNSGLPFLDSCMSICMSKTIDWSLCY